MCRLGRPVDSGLAAVPPTDSSVGSRGPCPRCWRREASSGEGACPIVRQVGGADSRGDAGRWNRRARGFCRARSAKDQAAKRAALSVSRVRIRPEVLGRSGPVSKTVVASAAPRPVGARRPVPEVAPVARLVAAHGKRWRPAPAVVERGKQGHRPGPHRRTAGSRPPSPRSQGSVSPGRLRLLGACDERSSASCRAGGSPPRPAVRRLPAVRATPGDPSPHRTGGGTSCPTPDADHLFTSHVRPAAASSPRVSSHFQLLGAASRVLLW